MIKTKNKHNKRGELTTTQLVTIIILITSFVIILFLIFRLDLGATTDAEICHNSVVLQGQSPLPSGPLDCKTQYVCLSEGRECQNFSANERIDVSSKNETMNVLAEQMIECWWQFGEGKIDYRDSSQKTPEAGSPVCALCSIVSFDDALQEKSISYQDFYDYLRTTKKTTSQTYLQYIYDENDIGFLSQDYLQNRFEAGKQYFILTAVAKEGIWGYTPFVRFFVDPNYQPPIILEKNPENYDKVDCAEFVTKA